MAEYEVTLGPELSIHGSHTELFDRYDKMSYATVVNLYSLSKARGKLVLADINPKDDDCLFFLHTALVVKDLLGYQLEVRCSLWKWLMVNWKLRKLKVRVRWNRGKYNDDVTYVRDLMEFMQPLVKEFGLLDNFRYGDIYHAFYEKGYGNDT